MLPKLKNYEALIGSEELEKIIKLGSRFKDKHVLHINSTHIGGGVAEILNSLVILMNRLGIKTGWRILKGTPDFFEITKKIHNGLQGEKIALTDEEKAIYLKEIEKNSMMNFFDIHDLIFIHDPQPLALINFYEHKQPWVWRCHVDLSAPNPNIWDFVVDYIKNYDGYIISCREYFNKSLTIPHFLITPSIDPFSLKNAYLQSAEIETALSENGIDPTCPLITQISRYDKWKDPLGVIKIFEKIQKKIKNAQLVLLGDIVQDDPEGLKIYHQVLQKVKKNKNIIALTRRNDLLVNALQRHSDVIIQNSIKEGFGLTVTEAMWKETPVVARKTCGIAMQVIDGKTGFFIDNFSQAAHACIKLIKDKKLHQKIGKAAKEHVKNNFLITTHLYKYLQILEYYFK